MSPSYLAHERSYYYGTINDCTVVLKRKWLHNPVLYAVLPPIGESRKMELESMSELLSLGVRIKISEEDLEIYGTFPGSAPTPQRGNSEFIYNTTEVCLKQGRKFSNIRLAVNQASRLQEAGVLDEEFIFNLRNSPVAASSVAQVAEEWVRQRKKFTGQIHQADAAVSGGASASLIYIDGAPVAYRISEQAAPSWIIGAAHAWSPCTFKYNSYYIHWLDCNSWDSVAPNSFYNFGSAVGDKGLAQHKEDLGPCKKLQIFDLKPKAPVTAAEWKAAVPSTARRMPLA